jgi:CDP-glucose 4,6-dehydratase
MLRAPQSTRPWQHVLEPLAGSLAYAEDLAAGRSLPPALNFGPPPGPPVTAAELTEAMLRALGADSAWEVQPDAGLPEAALLALDSGLARQSLGWQARLAAPEAVQWTARWYAAHGAGADARTLCLDQIVQYEELP